MLSFVHIKSKLNLQKKKKKMCKFFSFRFWREQYGIEWYIIAVSVIHVEFIGQKNRIHLLLYENKRTNGKNWVSTKEWGRQQHIGNRSLLRRASFVFDYRFCNWKVFFPFDLLLNIEWFERWLVNDQFFASHIIREKISLTLSHFMWQTLQKTTDWNAFYTK